MRKQEEDQAAIAAWPAGYYGHRNTGRAQVFYRTRAGAETGQPLNPQLEVFPHSPSGLEWGYLGSGPAQLSLALLVDYLGDVAQAKDLYQDFKLAVVVNLPKDEWTLSNEEIKDAVDVIRAEHALRSENLDVGER